MNFKESINKNYAKQVPIDKFRAENLIKSAEQAIKTAKIIPINDGTSKTIFRELYEGLREYCEAIGYLKGYKFLSHESVGYFIKDILNDQKIFGKFDRFRKIRNAINYYGEQIEIETVKQAIKEIPELIRKLNKYLN
jgi:uncharacterized protein (UPF0332 family)